MRSTCTRSFFRSPTSISVFKTTWLQQTRAYASHAKSPPGLGLGLGVKPPMPPTPTINTSTSTNASTRSSNPTNQHTSTLPRPRLDYNRLLSSPAETALNASLRAVKLPADHLSHLDRLRSTQLLLLQKLSTIRSKQREVGSLIRTGLGDIDELKRQAKKLKVRIREYENTLVETESELLDLALILPNFSNPLSPIGPEENAITLDKFGPNLTQTEEIKQEKERDHVKIANYFNWLDGDASSTTTGSSWPYLKGTLALLEQALIQYSLSIAIKYGFEPVLPPDVIKSDIAWRCGFQPRDQGPSSSSQTYHIQSTSSSSSADNSSSMCLTGTAEIPLAGLFANRLLTEESLPRKVVGVGRAFRAEAGARGSDTRGLYRVHQFTKVELFAVTSEHGSEGMMEEIRQIQKEIAVGLGLTVRVLDMPTEELGASASRKYDMEAWMPGRGKWGEITSTSNCTDYQSRRLSITYRPNTTSSSSHIPSSNSNSNETSSNSSNSGSLPFVHTLNGTAAAIPRLLIALIENGIQYEHPNQNQGEVEDDDVIYTGLELPKVLKRFWIGGEEFGTGSRKGTIRWV